MKPVNFRLGNNETVQMTRRYPKLPNKVLRRDADISKKIINAWDKEGSHEKALSIYLKENKHLSDERYWELLRSVWVICGSVKNANLFNKLMRSHRKERYYFSTPEEAESLRKLPEQFDIFRATNDENDGGLSWTLSIKYAESYKKDFNKSKIIRRTINKEDVFAYIERNRESEILVLI